ncbi:hypothetical protein LTR56_019129 [Elasticomyces elasticus]|nr:hypothetical protein LTR56_019129 [Elasticomyces elasticus]
MSSPLSVKRRKLNAAAHTLAKPFVSPMRSTKADRQPLKDNSNALNFTYTPSTLAHTIQSCYDDTTDPPSSPARPAPATKPTPSRKPQRAFTSSIKRNSKDPAEVAAQKALSGLERRIRDVKTDIDILEQSHQITNSSTDDELATLAEKWRLASQQAAEELFGVVKERVCRMGGVAAWRESEKKKFERANGMGEFAQQDEPVDDDADCEFDSQGEELPEAEQEFRKKEKARVKQEAMDAADDGGPGPAELAAEAAALGQKGKPWQEEGAKEDDTFTMDMMLRSLNIELKVIGYDKRAQRWT